MTLNNFNKGNPSRRALPGDGVTPSRARNISALPKAIFEAANPAHAVALLETEIRASIKDFLDSVKNKPGFGERWNACCDVAGMLASHLAGQGQPEAGRMLLAPIVSHPHAPHSSSIGLATLYFCNCCKGRQDSHLLRSVLLQRKVALEEQFRSDLISDCVLWLALGVQNAIDDSKLIPKEDSQLCSFALTWIQKSLKTDANPTLSHVGAKLALIRANCLTAMQEYNAAEQSIELAATFCGSAHAAYNSFVIAAYSLRVDLAMRQAKGNKAQLSDALEKLLIPEVLRKNPGDLLSATAIHGHALAGSGKASTALHDLELVWLQGFPSILKGNPSMAVTLLTLRGNLHLDGGEVHEALEFFRQGRDVAHSLGASGEALLLRLLPSLVTAELRLSEDEAEGSSELLTDSAELSRAAQIRAPLSRAHAVGAIGEARGAMQLGLPDPEILHLWEQALLVAEQRMATIDDGTAPVIAVCVDFAAWCHTANENDHAAALLEKASSLGEHLEGPISSELAELLTIVQSLRGNLAHERNDPETLQKARAITKRVLTHTDPWSEAHLMGAQLDSIIPDSDEASEGEPHD
jgi:hypothetical protein